MRFYLSWTLIWAKVSLHFRGTPVTLGRGQGKIWGREHPGKIRTNMGAAATAAIAPTAKWLFSKVGYNYSLSTIKTAEIYKAVIRLIDQWCVDTWWPCTFSCAARHSWTPTMQMLPSAANTRLIRRCHYYLSRLFYDVNNRLSLLAGVRPIHGPSGTCFLKGR